MSHDHRGRTDPALDVAGFVLQREAERELLEERVVHFPADGAQRGERPGLGIALEQDRGQGLPGRAAEHPGAAGGVVDALLGAAEDDPAGLAHPVAGITVAHLAVAVVDEAHLLAG